MELPTVAFDTPQGREYLGSLGIYAAPVGDSKALADGIQGLVENSELRGNLGSQLRRRAAQHFSWERSGQQLARIYDEVVRR